MELTKQPPHRIGQLRHAFPDFDGNLALKIAIGGARQTFDRRVDSGGSGSDGALRIGPAHRGADDRGDQRPPGILGVEMSLRGGRERKNEHERPGADRKHDRTTLERKSVHRGCAIPHCPV